MKFQSLRFEISILHTAILGVILILFSGILFFISTNTVQRVDRQLTVKAKTIDETIKTYRAALGEGPDTLNKAVQKTIAMKNEGILPTTIKKISENWVNHAQGLDLTRDYINFFNKNTKETITSSNVSKEIGALFMEEWNPAEAAKPFFKTVNYHSKSLRVITYPLTSDVSNEYMIQVGVYQDPMIQQLSNCLVSLLVILPLVLLLTSYAGSKQAARILAPVNEITAMANHITHQDLRARLKAKQYDPEMESLVNAFNDMIARLEKSFNHIEEFSHHVAHELKTPLTIIKGEADLLLRKERSKEEYQRALRINLEESERVLKIIEDLLLVAKLDYQPEIFKFEIVDFKEFFTEVYEQSQIVANQKEVSLVTNVSTLNVPVMIKADKLHLRRLFFNIIDNAVKFTPPKSTVDININQPDPTSLRISVIDSGPGIPPENVEKIFDKFFRSNSSAPGTGLGLNIANTIAKLHKGNIYVESRLGRGTTFHITLPVV